MTKMRKKPNISNRSKNKEPDANSQEEKNTSVHVIKKEKLAEDFIPFQQTFVNVSDTKKEETHNVLDLSESDPLNTKYISQITDCGHTKAKSLIFCGPNSSPNPK